MPAFRWLAALALLPAVASAAAADAPKYNVLFIAVDDLRPQLGCYGDPLVKSPHIDRLAARALVCDRAYCQQAVCSPSRTSLLTGRRPDTTRVYDLQTHFRTTIPDVVTLPQFFKQHGYVTRGLGKIYHGGLDDAQSWSAPHETAKAPGYGPEARALVRKLTEEARQKGLDLTKQQNRPRGPAWEAPDVPDNALVDGAAADRAVELLRELKGRPFFLAVGFAKPHLPFVAPKRYWDPYDPAKLPSAPNPKPPQGAPGFALHNFAELRSYHGMLRGNDPVTPEQARSLVHGYYACVSYLDAQVGRVLDELQRLGLAETTIVVLWGDHGWFLGEHGLWCKHANYEACTRVPLILAVPGQTRGQHTPALVEFVDIYPTLAELCGLPKPDGLEGTSFAPLVADPARPWKSAAFSQYPRQVPGQGRCMGHALRTDRYRLVEWAIPEKEFRRVELYDYQADPHETANLAERPDHAELVKRLTEQLRAGWRGAVPR
jgi:iduronate 2-sulfatase